MGRGVVALIVHELGATIANHHDGQALVTEVEERLSARAEKLYARERRLKERERNVREAERLLRARTMPMAQVRLDVGRNDPCPCGSGLKYKRCHGG
jgi:uncharacterized protein YecA (UPF0149 family)